MSQGKVNGCGESPQSPQVLFVFVGEFIEASPLPYMEDGNHARFFARYRIVERICGNYEGDTISFNVIQDDHDSSFMRSKFLLLALTKDTTENDEFALWAGLYNDLFKTTDGHWAGPPSGQNNDIREPWVAQFVKPKKTKFSNDAFYNTTGMRLEVIHAKFPEPYYRIKKNKAIPVLGNTIEEIFESYKRGVLNNFHIYEYPDTTNSEDSAVVVQDVILEEVPPYNDSTFRAIKDDLLKDPFNDTLIRKLVRECYHGDTMAACSQYFDDLIHKYPDSARAYIVKAKFMYQLANLEDTSGISLFKQAIKADSNNYEANYLLALCYYNLFRLDHTVYYAKAARKWLMRTETIDTAQRVNMKYPIIQLSNYLNDTATINFYKKYTYRARTNELGIPTGNPHNWYFPFEPFMNLKRNWIADYKVDVLRHTRSISYFLDRYSSYLKWFEEPLLTAEQNGEIYRLLWIRSFLDPVVIRIENHGQKVTLQWKVWPYNDELERYDSMAVFKKKLSVRKWHKFQKLLKGIDYWSMLSPDYNNGFADGAIWLLEGAANGRYHVTERHGDSYLEYTKCLKYLVRLTGLKIPKDEIY